LDIFREKGKRHLSFFIGLAMLLCCVSGFCSSVYNGLIDKAAKKHGIDSKLIKAVIWRESKFKPDARGKAGEIGLMQIKKCVAGDWAKANNAPVPSEKEMFNPAVNIKIGTWYLTRAVKSWHAYKYSYVLALCEYNAGRQRMREWLPNRKHEEIDIKLDRTRHYVSAIFDKYLEYGSESGSIVAKN